VVVVEMKISLALKEQVNRGHLAAVGLSIMLII
jgi:hypothetical protein